MSRCFPVHFDWAQKYNLPMYLHSRNCKTDFLRIVKENRHKFTNAVVHSYTGDEEELLALLGMGLYIGVNGCSLKTPENVEIVKKIPLDRIMLESKLRSGRPLLRNQEHTRRRQIPENKALSI
jgi:TatD DNase family protein